MSPVICLAQISVLLGKILLGFLELCLDKIFPNPINSIDEMFVSLYSFSVLKPLSSGLEMSLKWTIYCTVYVTSVQVTRCIFKTMKKHNINYQGKVRLRNVTKH